MISSPRTSKSWGTPALSSTLPGIVSGRLRTVRTFGVTSSPVVPSPRVIPAASLPSAKRNASDSRGQIVEQQVERRAKKVFPLRGQVLFQRGLVGEQTIQAAVEPILVG